MNKDKFLDWLSRQDDSDLLEIVMNEYGEDIIMDTIRDYWIEMEQENAEAIRDMIADSQMQVIKDRED